jgi:AraC-like DNA-binding protein
MNTQPCIPAFFFPALIFLIIGAAAADDLQQCVRFLAPEQKAVIVAPFCTLGVASSCKPIEQVVIMARYLPPHLDSTIVDTIARLNGPSFRYIWSLSSIPNQLSMGIGIIIEVTFADGEMFGTRREGIFLAHQKIDYPTLKPVAYDFATTGSFGHDTLAIATSDPSRREFVQLYWNEQALALRVTVQDPAFNGAPAGNLLDRMGIEVCVDPDKKRSLYPSGEDLFVVVPLSGQPYRKTFQPIFNSDGSYELDTIKTRLTLTYAVDKQTGKGFTATVAIPAYLFGKSIPPDMGFNVIVNTNDGAGNLVASSLIDAEGYNKFSPELWPTLVVLPKPISKVSWIIWLACFLAGIAVPLVLYLFFSSFTRASPADVLARRSEAEQREFGRIREVIDNFILEPSMQLSSLAAELQTPLTQLKIQVKRSTGLSLRDYIRFLRTEIVCERLRSSDATDEVVASTGGFRGVKEMQRSFRRFYRMSPTDFRKTQKIEHG